MSDEGTISDERIEGIRAALAHGGHHAIYESDLPLFDDAWALLYKVDELRAALAAERAAGAREMRERAAAVARERGHSHAMECRGHEAHTCITLADDIEALPLDGATS